MDENKIYDLLFKKLEILQKKLSRTLLHIYLFPIIYLLLDNSIVSTIKTPIISINQKEIIIILFPFAYAILFLLITLYSKKEGNIRQELIKLEQKNTKLTAKIEDLLLPIFLFSEYNTGAEKKSIPERFFFHAPVILYSLLSPFAFMAYSIYRNFSYEGNYRGSAIFIGVLATWTFIASVVRIYSDFKFYIKLKRNIH